MCRTNASRARRASGSRENQFLARCEPDRLALTVSSPARRRGLRSDYLAVDRSPDRVSDLDVGQRKSRIGCERIAKLLLALGGPVEGTRKKRQVLVRHRGVVRIAQALRQRGTHRDLGAFERSVLI